VVKVFLTVKAPDNPGEYVLQISLFQKGVGWFDLDKGVNPIKVGVTVSE
jgi:hypothetical protein